MFLKKILPDESLLEGGACGLYPCGLASVYLFNDEYFLEIEVKNDGAVTPAGNGAAGSKAAEGARRWEEVKFNSEPKDISWHALNIGTGQYYQQKPDVVFKNQWQGYQYQEVFGMDIIVEYPPVQCRMKHNADPG